jgi:hypothetical protein
LALFTYSFPKHGTADDQPVRGPRNHSDTPGPRRATLLAGHTALVYAVAALANGGVVTGSEDNTAGRLYEYRLVWFDFCQNLLLPFKTPVQNG